MSEQKINKTGFFFVIQDLQCRSHAHLIVQNGRCTNALFAIGEQKIRYSSCHQCKYRTPSSTIWCAQTEN